MKRYINIVGLLAVFAGFLVSCQEPLIDGFDPTEDNGYVSVSFNAQVPDMDVIQTKAVDPDGEDITGMTLFCFNERGLFVSTERATITRDPGTPSLSGTYKAELPIVTSRIHFVANLHKDIMDIDFVGMSESQVLSTLTGSSGMMSYWARIVKEAGKTIEETLISKNPVVLLRDHARITVTDKSGTYSDLAFVAVNTNAFGTVAPFMNGEWTAPSKDNPFVTLPESDLKASGITDVVSVAQRKYQYVFETENTSDDPVSVIIKGTSGAGTKYFRVMLIDEDGEFIPVMRNFTYEVQIQGDLDYGQDTFAAALTAPASNNVWISVSDDIKAVSSAEYTLAVKETHIVLGEDDPVFNTIHQQYTVHYSLESLTGDNLSADDKPVITWLDGNNVAQQTIDASEFVINGKKAEGQVDITLLKLAEGQLKREGTLLIKKGLLERKVKIVTVAKQKFTPAWITTNIYGGETGENVTMMFHISEECPEELFPMDVLVSVNDMDVRNASGMVLPIIMKGEDGYGEDNGIGYKYVLTVTEPGVQRVYLETILDHNTGDVVNVTVEAKNFETLTKSATFQGSTDSRILIHNLRTYVAATPADEYIYYYFVPQKINARVEFDTHLGKVVDAAPSEGKGISLTDPKGDVTHFEYIPAKTDFDTPNVDEFLLYSENLEHNHDLPSETYYFDFYKIEPLKWSTTAGRVLGLYRNNNAATEIGATLHLKTNKPKADEVVRIATNPKGSPSVTTGTYGRYPEPKPYESEYCTGTGLYKSAVFELTTFHPFHFSAQVKDKNNEILAGGVEAGPLQPADEDVRLSYEPGQTVNVEFDVTSFKSNMQGVADADQVSVDPFGTSFEIYIDAPTLKLDISDPTVSSLIAAGKIREEGSRVVYVVDADRASERTYFTGTKALAEDTATKDVVTKEPIPAPDQNGERKVLPFKTKDIVSAGAITISSDESKVVYHAKTFNLQNRPIAGFLTYGIGSTRVPAGTFVPFSTNDGTRIGVVTVGENGSFELRLRAEYEFDWNSTPVKFECKVGDTEYSAEYTSLAALFANPAVNMQSL